MIPHPHPGLPGGPGRVPGPRAQAFSAARAAEDEVLRGIPRGSLLLRRGKQAILHATSVSLALRRGDGLPVDAAVLEPTRPASSVGGGSEWKESCPIATSGC